MKRIITSAIAFAILTGTAVLTGAFTTTASAQGAKTRAEMPHKVGLIDMAYVFQEYTEFKMLREDLKSEIERSESKAKQYMAQSQTLQGKLRESKQGSDLYVQTEKQLLQLKGDFEAYKSGIQRDLMRKESKIYKAVYVKVAKVVQQYCDHFDYTLVMRFNRKSVNDSEAPGDIVQGMNRQVVYFQQRDDITDAVLKVLNQNYSKSASAGARRRTPATSTSARRQTK